VKVSNVNDLWGKEFMDVALGVEAKLTSIIRGNVVVANNKKNYTNYKSGEAQQSCP